VVVYEMRRRRAAAGSEGGAFVIVVGGFLVLLCGVGLALVGHAAVGGVVALLGLAAMLLGSHDKMR
jgi:hypothetical protein